MANKSAKAILDLEDGKFKAGMQRARNELKRTADTGNIVRNTFAGMFAGFSVGLVIDQLKRAYEAFEESERVQKVLESTIKSTGGAAGLTGEQIADMASEFMNLTAIDDEVIKGAQNILLTFTNIGKDVFPDATQAVLDMATVMGTDFNSAATQLGKALNDPINGLNSLRRVGVSFTAEQKEMIKTLVATGKGMEAQKIILEELKKEFGGAAEAGKTGLKELSVAMGELQETIGNFVSAGVGLKLANAFAEIAKNVTAAINAIRVYSSSVSDLTDKKDLQIKLAKNLEDQKKSRGNGAGQKFDNLSFWQKMKLGTDDPRGQLDGLNQQLKNQQAQEKIIRRQIELSELAKKAKQVKSQNGENNFNMPKFSGGGIRTRASKTNAISKEDAGLTDFNRLNEDLNRELQARKNHAKAIEQINKDYNIGENYNESLQSLSDTQINELIGLYEDKFEKLAEIEVSKAKNKNQLILKEQEIFQNQKKELIEKFNAENESKEREATAERIKRESQIDQDSIIANNKVVNEALEAELEEHKKHADAVKQVYDKLNESLYDGIGDNLRKLAQETINFKGFMLGVLADIARKQAAVQIANYLGNNSTGFISSALRIGAAAFGIPIPAHAQGTSSTSGGLALVGENGPELVNLPQGTGVTPNNQLNSIGNQTVNNITMAPNFQSLDPATSQKMFENWFNQTLSRLPQAISNNQNGLRNTIRAV